MSASTLPLQEMTGTFFSYCYWARAFSKEIFMHLVLEVNKRGVISKCLDKQPYSHGLTLSSASAPKMYSPFKYSHWEAHHFLHDFIQRIISHQNKIASNRKNFAWLVPQSYISSGYKNFSVPFHHLTFNPKGRSDKEKLQAYYTECRCQDVGMNVENVYECSVHCERHRWLQQTHHRTHLKPSAKLWHLVENML